jgi:beta-lactamase regulating signal transducer with metallopeptidase domain
MNTLLDMLVPAIGLSSLALACLALLPRAPTSVRLWITAVGLAAWAVPWPLLKWTLPLSLAESSTTLELVGRAGAAVDDLTSPQSIVGGAGVPLISWLVAAAFAVGAGWLIVDCVRARDVVRSWRARSTDAEALRELLPAHLRATKVAIRTVRESPHAAASGYLRPTIWIGDEIRHTDTLRVALLHECWHVRRHDPLKVLLLTALRRFYWWNPLVFALAKHAALLLEAECDRRCAHDVGKRRYVTELARTMLAASNPPPLPLAAAAGTRGSNLLRLDLLNREALMRTRDHLVLWAFALCAVALAACKSLEPEPPAATVEARNPVPVEENVVEDKTILASLPGNRGIVVRISDDTAEMTGDLMARTTMGQISRVTTRLFSVGGDTLRLTGDVLLTLGSMQVEADEVTIRTLDGRPFDFPSPQSRSENDARPVEVALVKAHVTGIPRKKTADDPAGQRP